MKIKDGFELREVCGEKVILACGMNNIDFSKIVSLNETAAFLWTVAIEQEFTEDMLVKALLEEYEVDDETARRDVANVVSKWKEIGLLD
ncbi:MAG TPA: PqqD family protein [Candidatus Paraprevotella stercorigallinarum]|nr:PqqD family protein [Candidatus Paraprevotella stercorigallinarum]